jgi:hypothetical protein
MRPPRHVVALALVGWYLMMPPLRELQAPLSRWRIYKAFDTAEACEHELVAEQRWVKSGSKDRKVLTYSQDGKEQYFDGLAGQCVATDDPRLKGK